MPPAARITDLHTCPAHAGGPVVTGFPTVIIGHQPAARITDAALCAGPKDVIAAGSATVLIGHHPAARMGDATGHGGVVATGFPTVIIGTTPQAATIAGAGASGAPFCAECERARREEEARARRQAAEREDASTAEEGTADGGDAAKEPAPTDAPTDTEAAQASAPGDTLEQRAAREKVTRHFYDESGLGSARADVDLGVGGWPPRANQHPKGFGIDVTKPVSVVALPPVLSQLAAAGERPGHVFDPRGALPELGAAALGEGARAFTVPAGVGLLSTSGPGAGRVPGLPQITVPDAVRRLAQPARG
jgi:uncharacterized Zn-binding protein involved in type VI secretion